MPLAGTGRAATQSGVNHGGSRDAARVGQRSLPGQDDSQDDVNDGESHMREAVKVLHDGGPFGVETAALLVAR
jgi:hypothetical protein